MKEFRRFFRGLPPSILWSILGLILLAPIVWSLYLRLILGYVWADWTGLENKNLWDWLELFLIPLVLAIVGILFTTAENRTEREISQDQLEENILSSYIDKIEEILANERVKELKDHPELVKIIEGKTLAALRRLSLTRKEILIRFLSNRNLHKSIYLSNIDLNDAELSFMDLTEAKLQGDFQRAELFFSSLKKSDFHGSDFTDASFRVSLLEEANLSGTELVRANFTAPITMSPGGANLEGANLESADLQEANLYGTNLKNVNLRHAILRKADLRAADLRGADLTYTNLRDCRIDYRTLLEPKWELVWKIVNSAVRNRQLVGANLSNADLSHAMLKGANLSNANLEFSDLRHADLSGANLQNAQLGWCMLQFSKINRSTILDPKWKLVWTVVNKGVKGWDLSCVDFSDAFLDFANFRNVKLTHVDFTGASLGWTDLDGADLIDANLTRAFLVGAIITPLTRIAEKWKLVWELVNQKALKETVIGADLSDAYLADCNFSGRDLSGTNFQGADLSNSNFKDAKVLYKQLAEAYSLEGTIMPDGKVHN